MTVSTETEESELRELPLLSTSRLDAKLDELAGAVSPLDMAHRLAIKDILQARYSAGHPHAFGCFCDDCSRVQG